MPNTKEFNVKIKGFKNTQKITKTMKMVSASKLRKAQQAQANAKLYSKHIAALTSRISETAPSDIHPLLKKREKIKNAFILVITSDKGLCGAFNNNCHKQVLSWISDNKEAYENIDMSFCGKRGYMFFKKSANLHTHYENSTSKPDFENACGIGRDIINDFINEKYDEVYLAYNQFLSPIAQKTLFEKVLPIDPSELLDNEEEASNIEYTFEPEAKKLLEYLIPHYLYFKIHFALLENSAGEHGARMSAMDNATKNATELIDKYTLLRNRARQAAITTELTEIVAGAEAL